MSQTLFDRLTLGTLALPNRLVRSATWEGMCEDDGRPTPQLVQLYRRLARGGTGLLISGYTYVRGDGKQLPGKMGIDSDALIPSLRGLTDAVHEENGLIFCQLVHAGGQTSSKVIGTTPVAPSAITAFSFPEEPRALDEAEIAALVAAFGEGARRAKAAGFDGVQLHGAHGYLINQFLSPLANQRGDRYGGPLENRLRFLEEVYQAVRSAVGSSFPVTIKLTASDNLPGGFVPEEAVIVAKRLEQLGIDALEISSGTAASGKQTPARMDIDTPEKEAYNAPFARQIKQNVSVPVMVVGGLRSVPVMERLLREGCCDLFALSRPLIREPDLGKRWAANPDHRATCTSCNGCFKPGLKGDGIYCVLDGPPA